MGPSLLLITRVVCQIHPASFSPSFSFPDPCLFPPRLLPSLVCYCLLTLSLPHSFPFFSSFLSSLLFHFLFPFSLLSHFSSVTPYLPSLPLFLLSLLPSSPFPLLLSLFSSPSTPPSFSPPHFLDSSPFPLCLLPSYLLLLIFCSLCCLPTRRGAS